MNEMTDSQKLEVLIKAIKAECERLSSSQEQGVTDMRYRLENALLGIGVEPYTPYPEMVLVIISRQGDDGLKASEDEQFYARYGA